MSRDGEWNPDAGALAGPARAFRLVARAPAPRFLAAAGSVLALVLTLFSAFESVSGGEEHRLLLRFATRLAIDYASLAVVVLVVATAKVLTPEWLFGEPPSVRAIALSFVPYTVAGTVGGLFRYHARLALGMSWQVAYPVELWTNVAAGILTFTMIGFLASQYYPLLERLERLRALGALAGQAGGIAERRAFGERLDSAGRADEVGYLARTVNDLLATVEGTLRSHYDFLADTSHELRNPLLAIRVNLDTLGRTDDARTREECLRESSQQIDRMGRLVADLLTLARLESGQIVERQPVALRPLLEAAAREAARLSRGQAISLGPLADVTVLGDEVRLRQVMANLLGNALKHTPPGGTITLSLATGDGWATIAVADTGRGIAPEHLPRLFDRFYRVGGPSTDGDGLGLAIVRHLCAAHGGQVGVESEPGRGSRFTVRLPLPEWLA